MAGAKRKKRAKPRRSPAATAECALDQTVREFLQRDQELAEASRRRVEALKHKAQLASRRPRKS
jgi:hypothetical protein